MVRINRMTIVFIMVFFFSAFIIPQGKQSDKNRQLREEILAVYQSEGEQGLRDFLKKQKDKITNKFIVDFAEAGLKEAKEEWLRICKIMVEDNKDEKTLADVLYITGVYFILIDNKKAADYLDKALPFFEKAGEPRGQGLVYLLKGEIYLKVGDNSWAQKMFNKALLIFEKIRYLRGQGDVYLRKGDINFRKGDNSKALEMYEKALTFFEKNDSPLGEGNVYLSKGKFYFKNGDSSKAVEMYDKALEIYKKIGEIESESFALYLKANIVAKKGKKIDALAFYEKAIFNLEKVRTKTAFSEMEKSFMEKVYKQYEETVTFMLENKYYYEGFKYAESMKSRVFLDRMAEELVRLNKGLTPDLKEKRDNLVAKLSLLNKQIYEAAGGKDEKKLQKLKEQYRKTEDEFDELLIKIRLKNPLYAAVNYPQPVSVRDLQMDVLKKGETLLSYFISQEKTFAFIVSKENFRVKQLKGNEKEINGLVERYLLAIKENNAYGIKRYGSLLYEKLFKPLEKY